jgi:hypothetical protein
MHQTQPIPILSSSSKRGKYIISSESEDEIYATSRPVSSSAQGTQKKVVILLVGLPCEQSLVRLSPTIVLGTPPPRIIGEDRQVCQKATTVGRSWQKVS